MSRPGGTTPDTDVSNQALLHHQHSQTYAKTSECTCSHVSHTFPPAKVHQSIQLQPGRQGSCCGRHIGTTQAVWWCRVWGRVVGVVQGLGCTSTSRRCHACRHSQPGSSSSVHAKCSSSNSNKELRAWTSTITYVSS